MPDSLLPGAPRGRGDKTPPQMAVSPVLRNHEIAGAESEDDRAAIVSAMREIEAARSVATEADRRPMDEVLRESEFRYRQVVQSLPVALYTCDTEGRITLFNLAAVALWGREPQIGKELWCGSWRIFRPDGTPLQPDECPMGIALREGRAVEGQEIIIERPDGSRRHVMPYPQPIRDAQGKLVGAMNMLMDITEMKRAETALKEAKESAEAANRSKDKFLAVLSHELRTPLTPVLLAASAMQKNPQLPLETRNDAAMICDSVRLETKLIDDLLDLSRITNGKLRLQPEAVDLNDTVLDVCDICRTQFREKRILLHCDFDERVGCVMADPARLHQVLWNVLNNAAKFTPEGGNVYINTSYGSDGQFRVQVKDTGVGIAADQLTRIFNAFEQGATGAKRDSGGLGLGLAISKALMELHNGAISVVSEGPSQGALFTIELPAHQSVSDDPRLELAEDVSVLKGARILIVEDHADTAKSLARFLQMSGCSVTLARNGAEALDRASKENFDVLLSDLGLPDMSGYELIQRLRSSRPIKGVALSGYGMDEDIRKSREAGFLEHMVKPLDIAQLERVLCRVITAQAVV
jgi:PAS domain S-box-containing protein